MADRVVLRPIVWLMLLCSCTPAAGSAVTLATAVRDGDVKRAAALLEGGANPNELLADESSLLAWAVDHQDREMTRLLLRHAARVSGVGAAALDPILIACRYGDAEILDLLLVAGANARAVRPDGISALALCAGHAPSTIVERVIAAGAEVDAADEQGQTPLMWAAANGRVDTMELLLAKGAQVNRVTRKGFTPLFFALKSGNPQAPVTIVGHGGNPDYIAPDGTSVVQLAMYQKSYAFAERMIERGVNLAAFDREGYTLLHAAIRADQRSVVHLLIAKGADVNALTGHSLVTRRFEVNFTSAPYKVAPKSPLQLAAESGNAVLMRTLVAAGSDAGFRDADGTDIVLAAASGGRLAALEVALQLQPDANIASQSGQTPLHVLLGAGNGNELAPMMKLLAARGARPDIANRAGKTPFDIAPDAQTDARAAFAAVFEQPTMSQPTMSQR